MTVVFSDRHWRFVLTEIVIGTVLGSVLPAVTMYLTLGPFPMPVSGADGLLWFMAKNALGMGTVMTLLMTLAVRARVRKGTAPALGWERSAHTLLRLIPRNVVIRAVFFGLLALAGPGLAGVALIGASLDGSVERLAFAWIMATASAGVAVCLIPCILLGALTDSTSALQPKVRR